MTSAHPKRWSQWLGLAQWWYNSSFHTSLNCSPFQALFGRAPTPLLLPQQPNTGNGDVDQFLLDRTEAFASLKTHLQLALDRMKAYADKKRQERTFNVGDLVYLRLRPYRQASVAIRKNMKLGPKYFGPYEITEKIGAVAYRLKLPDDATIHNVFHVSQLKQHISLSAIQLNTLPTLASDGQFLVKPFTVQAQRVIRRKNNLVPQIKVQWAPAAPSESTWEDLRFIQSRFPSFDLEDKVDFTREGFVRSIPIGPN
ncbi:hypothetical protein ACHQM5_013361 [Ranunculus cassubicifolius]